MHFSSLDKQLWEHSVWFVVFETIFWVQGDLLEEVNQPPLPLSSWKMEK